MSVGPIAVIGCGSIGSRHAKNLVALGARELILCDSDLARARALAGDLSPVAGEPVTCTPAGDLDYVIDRRPAAAIIATPTSLHLPMAQRLAEAQIHIFMEKPLSDAMEGVEELAGQVKEKNLIFMMGMCYRFHPGLALVKEIVDKGRIGELHHLHYLTGQYLPDWHPDADYREEYSARRSMGGGVILTSTIHGLDNVRWMFGEVEAVTASSGSLGGLEIDVEDYVAALLRLRSGAQVMLQADFLRRVPEHRLLLVGSGGQLEADLIKGSATISKKDCPPETQTYAFETNQMYLDEMAAFLESLDTGKPPAIGIDEGIRSLQLTLAVKESAESRSVIELEVQ